MCVRILSVTPSKWQVFPPTIDQPSEVVSCHCHWSYQEKALYRCHWSVRTCTLTCRRSSWWNNWNYHLEQIIQKWNYFTLNNRQRHRPFTKLATVTPLTKKTYDESFTKVNCQIHPCVIPFLTKILVILSFCVSSWVLQYQKEKQRVEYFQLERH